ncbi:hypothetical protein EMCRGX_G021623 [Ephydatia muelleri]
MDCDLVYQRQWYNNPVTIATIQDYLSKVSKEEWVIQECMNRVARDYETTRELLQYGLVKTSFRCTVTLVKIFLSCEHQLQHFIQGGDECGSEGSDSHCDEEKEGELSLEAMEAELTKCKRFTAQQTKLCLYRHILLSYMDSLLTYEAILGGPIAADEHFDDEFFANFRSKNLVQATIEYAQQTKLCQYRHILLSYMDSLLTYEAILGGPIAADEHFDDEFFVNFRSKNLVQVTIEYAQVCCRH